MRGSSCGSWLGALALAATAGLGCGRYAGSVEPPGDVAAFDGFAALPRVRDFVGPGARLVEVKVVHVPSTGRQDLTDEPAESSVQYAFLRPAGSSFERTTVEVVRPRWVPQSRRGKRIYAKHYGMRKFAWGDARVEDAVRAPACSLAGLWATARKHGAPADALATIGYDRTGYTFEIPRSKVRLRFDHACKRSP
jgi:hypothetical protein